MMTMRFRKHWASVAYPSRNAPALAPCACGRPRGDKEPPEPLLLTPEETAYLLSLELTKVFEMVSAGEIPVTRIAGKVRVPRDKLLQWIEQHTTAARGDAA